MSTRQLFIFIFFIAVLGKMFTVAPTDPDLWWHLRTGEYIVENGIPEEDPGFSYITEGREWPMHEWLSEVIMWEVYDLGGMHGLMFFFAIILASIFFILYLTSEHKPYMAAFITLLGLIASATYLGPRPHMFNLFLGAVFILMIERFRLNLLDRRWMFLLPGVGILWANLHSGFLIGLVILAVYIVGGILDRFTNHPSRMTWLQIRFLVQIEIILAFTTLLNPNTYQLWLYPFTTTFGSTFMQAYIQEWFSPDFHNIQHWGFGAYLLLGFFIMARSKRQVSLTELVFIVGTIAASLQQRRNIPIHVLVTVPIYSRHIVSAFGAEAIANMKPSETLPFLRKVNLLLAALLMLIAVIYVSRSVRNYDHKIQLRFPTEGVTFLQENNLDDNRIFNAYNWGGYLIWHDIQTFVDGRADLFGDDLLFDYAGIQFGSKEWKELLDTYEIEIIMINPDSALDGLLRQSDEWRIIFEETEVIIYQRSLNDSE